MTALGRKTLHEQLRERLMREIAAGKYKPGQALPNEVELARAYGLSAGTVRSALAWMEKANLIVREQGRGTFVRDTADLAAAERYMRVRTPDGALPSVEYQTLSFEITTPDAAEAAALAIAPSRSIRRVRRLNSVDGGPLSLEVSTVPIDLFELPPEEYSAFIALPALAKRCGVLLGLGEERLRLEVADVETAGLLTCPVGTPLFAYERVVFTLDRRPAEWKRGHGRLPEGAYYSAPLGTDMPGAMLTWSSQT